MKKRQSKDANKDGIETKKQSKKRNTEMAVITYIFMILFMVMGAYIFYFVIHDADKVLNNPANKRQSIWAKRVKRGSIYSADGKELAKTVTDEDGIDTRIYPYGELFAHVVGRTSFGATGLESSENYDLLTTNLNPLEQILNDINGEKSPGNDLHTTLRADLSQVASKALGDRKGAVVAIEPDTGRVVTMVSKPSYDPGSLTKAKLKKYNLDKKGKSVFLNRATSGQYPPGSTFKLYTALEYMRENEDDKDFSYKCSGSIGTGSGRISCYDGEIHGKVDLMEAFAKSCNTAFCKIGAGLDRGKWKKLCESLYYNTDTPIDKVSAGGSKFNINKNTQTGDVLQASIGQGTTVVTPLQNAFLVCAVLNRGVLMKPYVIDRLTSFDDKILSQTKPAELGSPITEDEAKKLKKLMRATVTSGTATKLYYGTPYKAGGKTGSAEYSKGADDSHAWFVGYATYKKKTLVVSVVVEGGGTGGAVAVPVAKSLFDAYWQVS